jgi:RecJ-like exonuclease
MLGLVSCVRRYAESDAPEYFVVVHDGQYSTGSMRSGLMLNVGEVGEVKTSNDTIAGFDAVEGSKTRREFDSAIEKNALDMLEGTLYKSGNERVDRTTEKMWKGLSDAMRLLARKLAIAAPIVIRFHNDIDGSSGAYALYKSITLCVERSDSIGYKPNIVWRMHGGVSYSREDATADILTCNNYECVEKPLLVVLDFGTSEASNDGVALAKEKFDIVWLDHHPLIEKFEGAKLKHYINPWNFGGDSNYTAGFLSCMFAKVLSQLDTKDAEEASFIGDYSEYSRPNPSSRKLAALLDLLTSDTRVISGLRGSLSPETIENVLKDKAKSDELIAYAENRVAEMLDLAIRSVKIYKAAGTQIYVADFESIRINEQERYPLPGRFASKLLGRIEELNKNPCVLLLHFGNFISVRMSKALIGRIDMLKALESVKNDYPEHVESTGGHSNAASIRMKSEELKKEVIKQTVEKLKKELEKG